jgi:hypothetical protein
LSRYLSKVISDVNSISRKDVLGMEIVHEHPILFIEAVMPNRRLVVCVG